MTASTASTSPTRAAIVSEVFAENYPVYQYRFVEFLTEHLSDASRTFRGDLQQMLVLAIIGQVFLNTYIHRQTNASPGPQGTITASRIADVTGIPRQTVRRKLEMLKARGWIGQLPDASYQLVWRTDTTQARVDLAELDRRGIDRVAELFCNLEKILKTHG